MIAAICQSSCHHVIDIIPEFLQDLSDRFTRLSAKTLLALLHADDHRRMGSVKRCGDCWKRQRRAFTSHIHRQLPSICQRVTPFVREQILTCYTKLATRDTLNLFKLALVFCIRTSRFDLAQRLAQCRDTLPNQSCNFLIICILPVKWYFNIQRRSHLRHSFHGNALSYHPFQRQMRSADQGHHPHT